LKKDDGSSWLVRAWSKQSSGQKKVYWMAFKGKIKERMDWLSDPGGKGVRRDTR
jgi:hypothetical protein